MRTRVLGLALLVVPMHCASYFSSDFPKGDRGGNDQLVAVNRRAVKLHAYWDALLGTSRSYASIAGSAAGIARDPRFERAAFKAELARPAFKDWVSESFTLAKEVAYQNGDLKTQRLPHSHDEGNIDAPDLPASYPALAKDTARKRAALAGHRLVEQLNGIFK